MTLHAALPWRIGLASVALTDPAPRLHPLDQLEDSHGTAPRAARMYTRFFGQEHVTLCDAAHGTMLRATLCRLVAQYPGLAAASGTLAYAKTQTHNTPAGQHWLRAIADDAGLAGWEAATVSMTNCASALAALHGLGQPGRPLIVLAGEKAFHPAGNRLSVGLLGEAPAAALFLPGIGRRVQFTRVEHLPRFHINPDDMAEGDRRAMQGDFEAGLQKFLANCLARYPAFFDQKPVLLPYNLNVPLVARVLERLDLHHGVHPGHSGRGGHCFCSDPFLNLAALPVPLDRPVFLFCAGMGVTYAALALGPAPHSTHQ